MTDKRVCPDCGFVMEGAEGSNETFEALMTIAGGEEVELE